MQKGNIFFKKKFFEKEAVGKKCYLFKFRLFKECRPNYTNIYIYIYITSPIAWFRALLIEHV